MAGLAQGPRPQGSPPGLHVALTPRVQIDFDAEVPQELLHVLVVRIPESHPVFALRQRVDQAHSDGEALVEQSVNISHV